MSYGEFGAPQESKAPKEGGKKGWGCLAVAALVIGLPVTCTVASSLGGTDDSWEPTTWEARKVCEGWVEDKLKAPATAEFTDGIESSTGVDSWAISGSVDAENSFGALVRSGWTCDIRWDASTERWRGSASLLE